MNHSIESAHIAELTRQRDALLRKTRALEALVRQIPGLITEARLDGKLDVPTSYDYTGRAFALNLPEA